jgi:hypothetical protein
MTGRPPKGSPLRTALDEIEDEIATKAISETTSVPKDQNNILARIDRIARFLLLDTEHISNTANRPDETAILVFELFSQVAHMHVQRTLIG